MGKVMIKGGKTEVFCVIGDPIEHTLSPRMQNAALEALGLDAVYVPFRVARDSLADAIRGIVSLGIRGINVTVPHKTAVMKYCDRLSDVAKAVGAVNTVINERGILTGDNTDVYGFEMCLLTGSGLDRFPERVGILGAGGAARGVVYACAHRPEVAEVYIFNRTVSRVEALAHDLSYLASASLVPLPADEGILHDKLPGLGLVVNTTSLGMYPDIEGTPVPDPDVFHDGQIVCDIIYNPPETKFLHEAGKRGAKTVGGLAMLAYQGARSLELWTGKDAPVEVMIRVLEEQFGNQV